MLKPICTKTLFIQFQRIPLKRINQYSNFSMFIKSLFCCYIYKTKIYCQLDLLDIKKSFDNYKK